MITFKERILQKFSHASGVYDDFSEFQQTSASELVKFLNESFPSFSPATAIDLGTGTGHVALDIYKAYPNVRLTINDLSIDMMGEALKKLPHETEAIPGDFEALELEEYNLIISNFAFQWAQDLSRLIETLKPKCDVLAFSCLLAGTFQEWSDLLEREGLTTTTLPYPQKEEVLQILKAQKKCHTETRYIDLKLEFPDVLSFVHYLKKIGASTSKESLGYARLKDILNRFKDKFCVDYKIMLVVMGRDS